MIACISPAESNYDETISTLRYASRAKNICNKPKINEDPKDAKLREYQQEIIKLKKLIEANGGEKINACEEMSPLPSIECIGEESENKRSKLQLEIERLRYEHIRKKCENEQHIQEIEQLKQHHEHQSTTADPQNNLPELENISNYNQMAPDKNILQLEACKRIEMIKNALIGGERANDTLLKEKRQKRKLDAQRRLSALAHVLSRVEQSEDRDILQGHYTSIQQELKSKNEHLKLIRQKNRALEREVSDVQVEFQLDRADYLDTIRRLEKNLKFYQQIMDKALPILRKNGRYWNPDEILQNSQWNDELKMWKLPETSMDTFKLPLTSSLRSKQYMDTVFQKCVNSTSSLQSTLNNVSFAPINYCKETASSNRYVNPKIGLTSANSHNSTLTSANGTEYADEKEKLSYNNNKFNEITSYDLKNYHPFDLDKTEILQNYFRSNRRKNTAEVKK